MITGGVSDAAWHADQAREVLNQIGKQQTEDGMIVSLADALAVAQVHAMLAVAEAIRERR